MLTIYFNQWFSTVREHFDYLREDFPGIRIVGSGQPNRPYAGDLDKFYEEPKFENIEDRVKFYLDICQKENVDFFFSYRWLEEINEYRDDFEKLGTKLVIPENQELLKTLNNKVLSAEFFKNLNFPEFKVPETIPCDTFKEIQAAVDLLKQKYQDVCIKYSEDVGGLSYHKIIDKKELINLYTDFSRRITMDELEKMYQNDEEHPTIVVMPYLSGTEFGIDCIKTRDQFIGILREEKNIGKVDQLSSSGPYVEMAEKISEELNIDTPFNIQFRYLDDIPYILEVNTRIAGGSHKCKFMNANFLSIYLKEQLGMENKVELKKEPILVQKIEAHIVKE